MALTIVVRSGDTESPPCITFDAPRIVIGRGDGCEVRLPDPSVSHRHASIRQRGTEYIVLDEGSSNGTFVGPVRLSPQASRVLKSGDRIRVGRVWLEVVIEHAPESPNPKLATKEIALRLVASALRAQGQDAQLIVSVLEGPDAGLELELLRFDKQYVIGRGKTADLQLTDADSSRRHVRLQRQGDRVLVLDLGSKNGSSLAGEPVPRDKPTTWKPEQQLVIGANRFGYQDPVAAALAELEEAPDETLDPMEDFGPVSHDPTSAQPSPSGGDTRAAPLPAVDENPRRAPPKRVRRLASPDLLVAGFALIVLALSLIGLLWLFGGP